MERRGQKYHRERLGEALREEIATILEGELSDPRIGLVNVSEVQLAPDARSARVFVTGIFTYTLSPQVAMNRAWRSISGKSSAKTSNEIGRSVMTVRMSRAKH